MRTYQTRVIKEIIFWRVQIFYCGQWQTHKDLHCTRKAARAAAKILAMNGY